MNEWTDGETAIIIEHGARKSDEELALALPGRSIAAIAKKRQREGIFKLPEWDERIPLEKNVDTSKSIEIHDLSGDIPIDQSVLMLFLSHADNYDIETLERTREVLSRHIDRKIRMKQSIPYNEGARSA